MESEKRSRVTKYNKRLKIVMSASDQYTIKVPSHIDLYCFKIKSIHLHCTSTLFIGLKESCQIQLLKRVYIHFFTARNYDLKKAEKMLRDVSTVLLCIIVL